MNTYIPLFNNKIYVGLLLLVTISMVSFFVVPDYLKIKALDTQIQKLLQTQEIQQKLRPLYDQISLKADYKKLPGLKVPQKGWFERSQIGNISQMFKDLAEKNDLECLQSNPDVDSLSGDSDVMLTSIILKGQFAKFRNFLFDMASLDYLESFEEIRFLSGQTGKKYMLKIWITIK